MKRRLNPAALTLTLIGIAPTAAGVLASSFVSNAVCAQNFGWTFNYQGELKQNGQLVNGSTPITFRMFDAAAAGTQVGNDLVQNVNVANGRFSANLDFTQGGAVAGVFDGRDRWIEIVVNGNALSPRQKIQTTPHAAIASLFAVPLGQDTEAPLIMHLKSRSEAAQVRALLVETTGGGIGNQAISGIHWDDNNEGVGVYGMSQSSNGFGVAGANHSPTGNNSGVYGLSVSPNGAGVYGYASSSSGQNRAIFGKTESSAGFAGYFEGRGYFSDSLGVGRSNMLNSSTRFMVHSPMNTGFGGMYVETAGAGAWPFYGYATNNVPQAWHYYDGTTDKWHVNIGGNRLTIDGTTGGVGIGTTSPAFLLHVNGSAGKPGGGSWTNASDARLKESIKPIDDALGSLLKLRGITFEYIDPASINELEGERIGVLAQEVEAVFPDWVDTCRDGYKTVTYRGFEALTVEALRELRDEKDAQVDRLERENNDLRDRVTRLEALIEGARANARQRGE